MERVASTTLMYLRGTHVATAPPPTPTEGPIVDAAIAPPEGGREGAHSALLDDDSFCTVETTNVIQVLMAWLLNLVVLTVVEDVF